MSRDVQHDSHLLRRRDISFYPNGTVMYMHDDLHATLKFSSVQFFSNGGDEGTPDFRI